MRVRNIALLVALVIACLAEMPARGQTFDWNDPAGGLFNDAANWTPAGPPNSNVEAAEFNLNNTFTVTFQTDVTNSNSIIDNGTVTFALSGRTYTLASGDGLAVGGVAGQTGRVTLTNGTVSGDMSVGFVTGATGFVTVGSDAVFDAGSNAVLVGRSGLGTLTISSGGSFTGTGLNAVDVGDLATGNGTLTVTGAGSSFDSGVLTVGDAGIGDATISSGGSAGTQAVTLGQANTASGTLIVTGSGSSLTTNGQTLTVGNSGVGDFTVSSGGTVTAGQIFLGNFPGSSGSMSVSGSTSSVTSSSGDFPVGASGAGSLEVTGGGTVNSINSRIAADSGVGSSGSATVSGSGSAWNATSLAIGGTIGANGGTGTLTIEAGGTVNVTGTTEIRSSAGSSLTLDGGTLTTIGFTSLGTFKFRDGTLHVKGIYDHGAAAAALVIDGATSNDLPTMRLSGNSAVTDVTSITVGSTNRGALILDGGRSINMGANQLAIGTGALSSGSVTVSGNSSLTTTGTIAVGGMGIISGGSGTLTIEAGSVVNAASIILFNGGEINLDGGRLVIGGLTPFGDQVNFNSGEIAFTTATSLTDSLLDALLGASHVLGADRRLSTSSSSLTFDAPLTVSGGDVFAATSIDNFSTLQLDAGSFTAVTTLTNNSGRLVTISGTAAVTATSGITNNGTIQLDNNLIATSGGTLINSGTIRGSGFVGNNLTNNAAGQVQITAGHRIEFQGTSNTNSGSMSLIGGELVFTGSMTNSASTGLISGRDAILRVNGGITNNGSLAFTAGQMDVYGDITNNVGGRITVSGGGTATFYDDVTIAPGASDVQATAVGGSVSSVVFFGSYNGGISGGGTAFIEGDHRPGNSPALVSFGGAVAYGGLARLFVEVGGTSRGGQYDAIDAADAAQLGGTLDVILIGGFTPIPGDEFQLITAGGGVTGQFTDASLPTLSGANWQLEYDANSVSLHVALTGDYNRDGAVNAADYTTWRNMLNQAGIALAADGNNDGMITRLDFDVWKVHYGETAGSGSIARFDAADGPAVPEPSALSLLVFGAVWWINASRRRSAKLTGLRKAGD